MNAVITGATKGIGRATALKLAKDGFNLILGARTEHSIHELVDFLAAEYPAQQFTGLATDVANETDLKKLVEFALHQFPEIDVLVNNAGIFIPSGILDEEEGSLETQWAINVKAAHYLCKAFGKKMRENQRGHIFNICSIAGKVPVATAGSYSVTKFALVGLTNVLREELKPNKVKVTAVIPGSTLTDSWSGTTLPAELFVQAEDVALAISAAIQMSSGANVDEIVITPLTGQI